jgi:nitroreductase
MNFLDIAKSRYSSRKYLNKPIEEDKILRILEAGRVAPSAANRQPWIFYILQQKDNLLKIREVYHREWYKEAPVVIVACANHEQGWIRSSDNKDHSDVDLAIAITHIVLQATELGLGSCWVCNFDVNKCREVLNLPKYIEPVALIPLAYPADLADPERHFINRKPLSEIVKWL